MVKRARGGPPAGVPGAPAGLQYSVGGPECGGTEGEKVLREVEIDENAILQRYAFAGCRRILLYRDGRAVAAAVAEMHVSVGVLDVLYALECEPQSRGSRVLQWWRCNQAPLMRYARQSARLFAPPATQTAANGSTTAPAPSASSPDAH